VGVTASGWVCIPCNIAAETSRCLSELFLLDLTHRATSRYIATNIFDGVHMTNTNVEGFIQASSNTDPQAQVRV
jgi:hypothetical protein